MRPSPHPVGGGKGAWSRMPTGDGVQSKVLRIAFLIKRFGPSGGKEIYALQAARGLLNKGHQVDVYAYEADERFIDGITVHRVARNVTFSNVLSTLDFIRKTSGMLRDKPYDIIHSHERNYKQDVLTLHSFSYLSGLEEYSGLKRFDQKYLSLRSLCYLWLEKKQMASPWLISVSEAIAEDAALRYGRTGKMTVIRPGVDIDTFHPDLIKAQRQKARARLGVRGNELVIVFVGSAFKRKGLDRLIPALSKNMRLFVIGSGDHVSRYKRMVMRQDLEHRVQFFGFDEDVRKYYAAADAVALPSRSEAFGMTILEAMACGLATIVSSNSGVADIVKHGWNGFLMHEPEQLPDLLKTLFDEDLRSNVARRARMTAERYTWEQITAAHEACYERILSEKTG